METTAIAATERTAFIRTIARCAQESLEKTADKSMRQAKGRTAAMRFRTLARDTPASRTAAATRTGYPANWRTVQSRVKRTTPTKARPAKSLLRGSR